MLHQHGLHYLLLSIIGTFSSNERKNYGMIRVAPRVARDSAVLCTSTISSSLNLAPILDFTIPDSMTSNRSAALERNTAGSALCGNTEGRVRNRQPFLFSSSGSIAGAGPDAAPNRTTRPNCVAQSNDLRKVSLPTES